MNPNKVTSKRIEDIKFIYSDNMFQKTCAVKKNKKTKKSGETFLLEFWKLSKL